MVCALPLVQSVLNHTKSADRSGFAPMTTFTDLPASFPLQAIFDSTKNRHQNDSIVNRSYYGPLPRLETEIE